MKHVITSCRKCGTEFKTTRTTVAMFIDLDKPDMILCPACQDERIGHINEHPHRLDLIVKHLIWLELLSEGMSEEMLIILGTEMCIFLKTKYPDVRAQALHLAMRLSFRSGDRGLTNKYLFTRKLFIEMEL